MAGLAPGKTSVLDIESKIGGDGPSYTFDTMAALGRSFPDADLRFLIGGDSLSTLHSWRKAREIVDRWGVITVPRRGTGDGSEATERVLRENWPPEIASRLLESILPCGMMDVSSSEVRRLLAEGGDASASLPPPILEYIERKGLYKCRKR
jgi:nicotinate-nucleotide adenylyltransferase